MGQLALVFPGQGTQAPGMGQAIYRQSAAARRVMDSAEQLMPGLLKLCFEGPMAVLTRTDVAQVALLTVELALAAAMDEIGIKPDAVAGFSLGEWPAVQYAGLLPFERAFELVRQRGQWMQACADKRPGGMSAVLRLDAQQVRQLLLDHPEVVAANFNAPEQTVVAGPFAPLDAFDAAVKAIGGRSMRLNVAGAFHSPLMLSASDMLASALAEQALSEPRLPVYANLSAQPYALHSAREWLALQPSQSVQWVKTIENLAQAGVDRFLELGPGKVLSGLIGKILPGALCLQAEDWEGLVAAKARLEDSK